MSPYDNKMPLNPRGKTDDECYPAAEGWLQSHGQGGSFYYKNATKRVDDFSTDGWNTSLDANPALHKPKSGFVKSFLDSMFAKLRPEQKAMVRVDANQVSASTGLDTASATIEAAMAVNKPHLLTPDVALATTDKIAAQGGLSAVLTSGLAQVEMARAQVMQDSVILEHMANKLREKGFEIPEGADQLRGIKTAVDSVLANISDMDAESQMQSPSLG
jgi:hypothetical protein